MNGLLKNIADTINSSLNQNSYNNNNNNNHKSRAFSTPFKSFNNSDDFTENNNLTTPQSSQKSIAVKKLSLENRKDLNGHAEIEYVFEENDGSKFGDLNKTDNDDDDDDSDGGTSIKSSSIVVATETLHLSTESSDRNSSQIILNEKREEQEQKEVKEVLSSSLTKNDQLLICLDDHDETNVKSSSSSSISPIIIPNSSNQNINKSSSRNNSIISLKNVKLNQLMLGANINSSCAAIIHSDYGYLCKIPITLNENVSDNSADVMQLNNNNKKNWDRTFFVLYDNQILASCSNQNVIFFY